MNLSREENKFDKGAFAGLFVATAVSMLGFSIIEPIMPLYAKSMGASGIILGLIFSGFAISRGIFAPIMGQYSDNHGRKNMLLAGLLLYVILSIGYVYATTPFVLGLVRTVQGFASVMVTPIAQSYIGDITPKGKEGQYMNLFFISMFAGTALGPTLGGYLSDAYNLEAPFYAMAALGFLSLLLVFWLVPKVTETHHEITSRPQISFFKSLKKVFSDSSMMGLMSYMGSRGFYRWGFNTFFPILATSYIEMSKTGVGLMLSSYMLAGAVLQYPSGILADKRIQYRNEIILVFGLLSTLPMFIIPVLSNEYLIGVLVMLMGAFSAVSRASAVAIRTDRGRIHGQGAVTGAFTTSMSAGQVVGPIAFGAVVDVLNIPSSFYLGGIIGLLGSVVGYFFLKKDSHRGHKEGTEITESNYKM
ncbi:MAG TPA: MFS transporter [Balneolales bacterium]|nr:MFS transporter [Balneolales bacterium]